MLVICKLFHFFPFLLHSKAPWVQDIKRYINKVIIVITINFVSRNIGLNCRIASVAFSFVLKESNYNRRLKFFSWISVNRSFRERAITNNQKCPDSKTVNKPEVVGGYLNQCNTWQLSWPFPIVNFHLPECSFPTLHTRRRFQPDIWTFLLPSRTLCHWLNGQCSRTCCWSLAVSGAVRDDAGLMPDTNKISKLSGEWVQAFGATLNNGRHGYHWPIITNTCPPKRSQKLLRGNVVPIPRNTLNS